MGTNPQYHTHDKPMSSKGAIGLPIDVGCHAFLVCRAVGGCPCDEKCGGAGRMLAWAVNCTITAPPPSPAPPPRAIPYWIVKNSWSASYGDHGYIKMQRGAQGSAGLCCINCMPQYAVSAKGPPPARPSLIPTLCTRFTRAGIEWRR